MGCGTFNWGKQRRDLIMKRGVNLSKRAASIIIVLFCLTMIGTVSAADPQGANQAIWGNMTPASPSYQNTNSSTWNQMPIMSHGYVMMRSRYGHRIQMANWGTGNGAMMGGSSGIMYAGFIVFGMMLVYS